MNLKKNSNYWTYRQDQRLAEVEQIANQGIYSITAVYDDSLRRVESEIENILKNYAKNSGVEVDTLKELLTEGEQNGLLERIRANMYSAGALNNQTEDWLKTNYQYRLDKQNAIKAQIEAERLILAKREMDISKGIYSKGINHTYSSLTRDLTGRPGELSVATKESMLAKRWVADANYSERIWNNTGQLKNDLDIMLNASTLSGESPYKLIADIRDRYDVEQYQAARLVRTEMNHFHNQTTLKGYEDAGILEYEYSAIRDNRTSEICSDMNGKRFKVTEAETGVNYPPLHPNCRSTTIPVFPDYVDTNEDELLYKDTIKEWREQALTNVETEPYVISPKLGDIFKFKNNKYIVDGKNVVIDFSEKELIFAEWLSKEFNERVELLPRINIPEGIQTPDYIFRDDYWDLKEIKGNGKRTLDNAIKKKKSQSLNFMFDLDNSEMDLDNALAQIDKIYLSKDRSWVGDIIIKKNGKVKVIRRKKG